MRFVRMDSQQQTALPASSAAEALAALSRAVPEPKPWHLMVERTGFQKPISSQQARAKLLNNFSIFKVNYGYLVAASALVGLLFDLTAFAVTAVAAAAAAALLMDTRYVGVVVLKDITAAQRQMLAGGLCIATVTLSGAVGAASTGACVGAAACAVHGATYEPSPDFS